MLNGIIAEINCDGIYEDFVTVIWRLHSKNM